ncbi:hypothetical protein HQQ81_17440 [Microbacteriaceae bacterium VKM Ac-2854]|nr:hypothetical protein [Microbacteriaceae bacterium VKM Ac-2854]
MSANVAVDRTDHHTVDRWLWALVGAQLVGGAITALGPSGSSWLGVVPVLFSVAALYLARRDWRALGAAFERFHWLWAVFPPVYVIGRGAYLYRATGRGLVITVVSAALLATGYVLPAFLRLGAIG